MTKNCKKKSVTKCTCIGYVSEFSMICFVLFPPYFHSNKNINTIYNYNNIKLVTYFLWFYFQVKFVTFFCDFIFVHCFSAVNRKMLKLADRSSNIQAIDKSCKNKLKWSWLEEKDGHGDLLSEYMRKTTSWDLAMCIIFNDSLKRYRLCWGEDIWIWRMIEHAKYDNHTQSRWA